MASGRGSEGGDRRIRGIYRASSCTCNAKISAAAITAMLEIT